MKTYLKVISTGSQDGNCYAIFSDDEILLLDFGCKYQQILEAIDFKISNVVGALLTHIHGDHAKSYKEINRACIPIYSNKETVEQLGNVTVAVEKEKLRMGGFSIIPFYVPHDNTPNYAYMITLPNGEKLLYATDFGYLPYTFKKNQINHFLIECNHLDMAPDKTSGKYEHSIKGHSSLSTVKKIMQINKSPNLSNVILCHLSESWGNPEIMQHEIETVVGDEVSVKIAHSGLICELSEIPF